MISANPHKIQPIVQSNHEYYGAVVYPTTGSSTICVEGPMKAICRDIDTKMKTRIARGKARGIARGISRGISRGIATFADAL